MRQCVDLHWKPVRAEIIRTKSLPDAGTIERIVGRRLFDVQRPRSVEKELYRKFMRDAWAEEIEKHRKEEKEEEERARKQKPKGQRRRNKPT